MVFESLVADLLNKYLGEYVDNLDRSQLKIGIWGGDVVLKDLSLKQSALDELQLPVKTVSGFLGKLILKIPWKNLYSEPVEANIEDLYLLVAPNTEVKYDPVKEEKWKQEAKQAEISKVEEAKKSEQDKDKPKPNDTFTEKLATQIVRNVQLSIKNIHIRYEDRVHNSGKPFALGITLSNLLVTTTDENWKPCISKDMTSMIYKILEIESFSVYWNSKNSVNFLNLPAESILQTFKEGIATKERIVECYQYLLGPITASSKLRLNTKPESNGANFTQPKVFLDLNLHKLQIKISKSQYQDLMVLLDSMEIMSRAAPYRKYRPVVPTYKGYYKQWWRFAYECILEEEVRRRRRNWSWLHISAHRHLCKEYATVYRQKVGGDNSTNISNLCLSCESMLDVLNIVLVRQKIEMEVKRRESEELLKQKKQTGGWMSRWWGKAQKEETSTKANIIKQFEEAMTPSEKAKLYQAIGYQENSTPAQYPIEFVAVDLNFFLQSLQLDVSDESSKVLSGSIRSVCAKFEQRPAGQAFKVHVSLDQFSITGVPQGDKVPQLVETTVDKTALPITAGPITLGPLLDIIVEVNPLDKPYDQQVIVTSRPLNLVYDALTINKVVDVFTVEESTVISHIQSAANVTLSEFKAKSALGLQYALEKQSVLDLRVNLMGFYGILAHGGHYTGASKKQALVVINFGQLLINSKPRVKGEINVKKLHAEGISDDEIKTMVLDQSFDRFVVELRSVQIQMVLPGETWKIHRADSLKLLETSEQCILEPTNLEVFLCKSLLPDEPSNPRISIDLMLPEINLKLAERRFLSMFEIFMSIPFPESKERDAPRLKYQRYGSHQSLNKVIEMARAGKSSEDKKKTPSIIKKKEEIPPPKEGDDDHDHYDDGDLDFGDEEAADDDDEVAKFTQFTDLMVKFKLKEVSVRLFRLAEDQKEKPLADFHVLALESNLVKRTYDFTFDLRLGGLRLNQDFEGGKIHVINTPMAEGIADYLFDLNYIKTNLDSPAFVDHTPVIQRLRINFSRLDVLVYQEALLDAIQWAGKVQDRISQIMEGSKKSTGKRSRSATPSPSRRAHVPHAPAPAKFLPVIYEQGAPKPPAGTKKDLEADGDVDPVIDLILWAFLDEITVTLRNSVCPVASMEINGGIARIETRKSCNIIKATLRNFEFVDLNENTKHPKVLKVLGTENALKIKLFLYNKDVKYIEDVNMEVIVQMARFQVVFLNYFVSKLLEFSNQFCTTQSVIKEASAAAAGVAKVNMQQAYKEAYRVSLNIRLKAPIILVPANSSSLHALLMDFGVLNVNNVISEKQLEPPPEDENQNIPIIDTLNIGLQDFKISRVMLKPTMELETESLILQPSSFNVAITRNLCNDWFNDIPDLDISGKLESIHMILNQEDYIQVMAVVMENLGESPVVPQESTPVKTQPQPQPESNVKRKTTNEKPKDKTTDGNFAVEYIVEEEVTSEPNKISIDFKFELTNLVIELLERGLNKMDELDGAVCPLRSNNGLARFTLLTLIVRASMQSDGVISSSITLNDCLLDDTRASQYNICRYMERKVDTPKNINQMVEITFEQKNKSMSASVKISSFNLILNIEHLMRMADLFVSTQDQLSQSPITSTQQSKAKETAMKDSPVTNEPDPDRNINLTLRVFQPDIILVERMDPNTNAIIMNNEIDMKVILAGPLLSIRATVKNLQVFSCCLDPGMRRDTKAEILRPVTINLMGSTPSGQGLHVELSTTNIRLSVTPGTIELLNSVLTTLTASKQDNKEKEDLVSDYSELWHVERFNPENYWFLKTAEGQEASEMIVMKQDTQEREEICLVRVPSLVVTLEAGVGTKTLPMLLLESSLQAQARNWGSLASLDGSATFQVSYYNSRLALWEPLVEPVEVTRPGGGTLYAPWELSVQVETNDPNKVDGTDSPELVGVEAENVNKPNMVVNINSKETMEVTLTKTCLEVLKTLAISFNNAIFKPESKVNSAFAQYLVQNDLGMDVTLSLTEGIFLIFDQNGKQLSIREVVLESGAKVNLNLAEEEDVRSMVGQISTVNEKFLQFKFQVSGRLCELETPVTRADKRYFSLQVRGANNDTWGIVSDVEVQNGSTIITLRGIIQVHNHFHTPVRVYFMTKRGNEVELVGVVEPHRQLNLPLHSIYTPTNELFFSVEGYSVSNAPFVWKDLQQSLAITKILQCNAKNTESKEPFFIKVVGEMEQVYHELSNCHTMASTCYNIHLRPTIILKNFLPVDVIVCTQGIVGDSELKSGKRMQIPNAEPGHTTLVIRISQYLNKDWSCKREIPANPPELSVWTFQYFEGAQNTHAVLDLGMHCVNENGSFKLSLYCPFWMINKTGLMLSYRKSSKPENEEDDSNMSEQTNDSNVHYHPPHFKGPIMFSFRAKSFYGKKKSSIKVNKGEWSDKFSLDVAGSSGVVNCKANNIVYQVGVHIQLTYNTLTKQVTFTPYHILVNHCPVDVEVLELNGPNKTWIKVEPDAVTPFWPQSKVSQDKPAELIIRMAGTSETTVPFLYNRTLNCLLKLQNKYGAVSVDVQITEGAAYITFLPYDPGMAPALIINHSSYAVPMGEKDGSNSLILQAGEKILFNWSNTKENLVLTWGDKGASELKKDEIGEITVHPNAKIYWVTFLDGMQRVLLFTSDLDIAREAEVAHQFQVSQLEVQASIHGFGVSLVDNVAKQEILYLGITSSGVVWESRKVGGRKYKSIPPRDSVKIEEAYIRYNQEITVGKQPISKCAVGDNIVVDFATNEMLRPQPQELRRTYNQGLWALYRSSLYQVQLHVKVNRLQMDNQTFDCVFPVVFAPVAPPKSVAMDNVMKPFAELSLVKRVNKHTIVQQFKYFKLLIQEFHVKVDIGFINALVKMFEESGTTDDIEEELFTKDLTVVDESLIAHVTLLSSQEQKNFYDNLHLSPLKIHVSFSLSGGGVQPTQSLPPVLNVLMQSLGVTLTDIQDVVLKLSYFERKYSFLNQKQLMSEVQMHYRGQLIKQLYVLVFGLDVLGNPFGLVVGITEGVQDLFYEPFQGAIQGPGEFCEGLVLGVRSLLGHTVGGAAGAVSRITGAMGKGLAALTFDEDYQRKRRELMNMRPSSMSQGLAQSGKGLVMGVVEGVGGVFSKPISGAKEEGVEGFIKGFGKGMVGLVTRPTAGVIDFASGSFSAVKRATELGEEVTRLRDPRCFKSDSLVRPYCKLESQGNRILKELEKGKYYTTDEYAYHTAIGNAKCCDILLLTDKRLLVLSRNDIFGGYQVEFTHTWGEMITAPVVVTKGVEIKTGVGKKKLFRSNEHTRVIIMEGEQLKNYVAEKMKTLMFPRTLSTNSQ